MNDHYVCNTPTTTITTRKSIYREEGFINKCRSYVKRSCENSKFEQWKYYWAGFFFAFFFELLLSLLFSLTTGLSCVKILATASCIVGSNVYDADFVLATIWLISFAYALIVNNNDNNDNNYNNNSKSNKIYNDDDNISMMPTITVMVMMMMW